MEIKAIGMLQRIDMHLRHMADAEACAAEEVANLVNYYRNRPNGDSVVWAWEAYLEAKNHNDHSADFGDRLDLADFLWMVMEEAREAN